MFGFVLRKLNGELQPVGVGVLDDPSTVGFRTSPTVNHNP